MLMSREKIGQLFMVGFEGTSVTPDLAAFIKEYKPGGVILFSRNLESIEQIVELTNALQACSPHSPLLISIDQEGGRVSRCLLYTSDAADERSSVDLGGRRTLKKKRRKKKKNQEKYKRQR